MKRLTIILVILCIFVQAALGQPVFSLEQDPDKPENDVLNLSAALSSSYSYEEELERFPSDYQAMLKNLHASHPQWIFVAVRPGLDFNEVVNAESDGRSVIANSASPLLKSNAEGDYDPETGEYTYRDANVWVNANKVTVSYFMDPRNFLNEKYIWQFEGLDFDYTQTVESVESIISGTFMSQEKSPKIKYYNREGKLITLSLKDSEGNKYYPTYSQLIWQAGKDANINPLYLASKIRLEVGGKSGSVTGQYTTATGIKYNDQSLDGYYNFYNIGASDGENPISRGLAWAAGYPDSKGSATETTYGRPWITPARSILNGAPYIAQRYLDHGQNTGYFVRFNVTPQAVEEGRLYSYQYMTSIYGAASEAASTYSTYLEMNMVDLARVFYIPVFENMPSLETIPYFSNARDTAVIQEDVALRSEPTSSAAAICYLSAGTAVSIKEGRIDSTTVEPLYSWQYDPFWFKVTYGNYTGYVSAEDIAFTKSKTVTKGKSYQLKLTENVGQTLWYQSSDPGVATVDATGRVTAVKAGQAAIYAFTAHGVAGFGITVKNPAPEGTVSIASSEVTASSIPDKTFTKLGRHPKITLTYKGRQLVKGTDYSVSYRNNLWPGTATVIITGKGQFTGTRKLTFKITGTYVKFKTTTDVNYRDAAGLSSNVLGTLPKGTKIKILKKSAVTVDGIKWYAFKIDGRYCYISAVYLKKVKKSVASSSVTVQVAAEKSFTGTKIKPKVTVQYGGVTLKKGTDYSLSYKNNKWPGTATITIKGKGNYTGSRKVTFKIKGTYRKFKTTAILNYRTAPGLSSEVRGQLPAGKTVKVLSKSTTTVDGLKWVAIKLNGSRYFVSFEYLKLIK